MARITNFNPLGQIVSVQQLPAAILKAWAVSDDRAELIRWTDCIGFRRMVDSHELALAMQDRVHLPYSYGMNLAGILGVVPPPELAVTLMAAAGVSDLSLRIGMAGIALRGLANAFAHQ